MSRDECFFTWGILKVLTCAVSAEPGCILVGNRDVGSALCDVAAFKTDCLPANVSYIVHYTKNAPYSSLFLTYHLKLELALEAAVARLIHRMKNDRVLVKGRDECIFTWGGTFNMPTSYQ